MEVSFRGKLLTFLYFPDITQEEAVIDKKKYLIKLVTVEMYALSTSFEHITTEELETTGCIEMKETKKKQLYPNDDKHNRDVITVVAVARADVWVVKARKPGTEWDNKCKICLVKRQKMAK